MKYIFNKIKRKLQNKCFDSILLNILKTPPIKYNNSSKIKIVSMVGHTQVNMFLLAIKTFIRFYPNISIDILDDMTLTKRDFLTLESHIPDVKIISIDDIDTKGCPKRNCWERLVYIIECTKEYYVIQLDSDTVTLSPCLDVYSAIDENKGFVIGGGIWNRAISTKNMSYIVSSWKSVHVQAIAESVLASLDSTKNIHYLRGCAAFTGFPKGELTLEMLNEFSDEMKLAIGEVKWNEWGSEQLASNIMLSKTDNPIMLPWPKYQNYMNPICSERIENSSLIHFIGSNRFDKNTYTRLARKIIKDISE